MSRPVLTKTVSAEIFLENYWLKKELVDFCRAEGLPTSGGKQEITARIATFLRTGEIVQPKAKPSKKGKMPETFSRETVIGEGWRSSQDLRTFFEQEIGKGFHFNGFLRDFIKSDGVGQTLGDAIDGWHKSKEEKRKPISGQFEYNQHMRDFYDKNPGASREEAIAAWYKKRGKPN